MSAVNIQIAAFENGELRVYGEGDNPSEAVLALPLNRLLVKVVRVPADRKDAAAEVAVAELKGASPFPDEELTVGIERIREEPNGSLLAIAAALPVSSADDIGEAIDEKKLSITRIDALALGELRALWPRLGDSVGRRLFIISSADCLSLFVLDGDSPVAIRALSHMADLKREVLLSLIEAERVAGPAGLEGITLVGFPETEGECLSSIAPLTRLDRESGENEAALSGICIRSCEAESLDATPSSWREVLEESRFKAKIVRNLGIAAFIWALIMGVLVGVPFGYGYLTNRQKTMTREHSRQYKEVEALKQKVELIQKYSDHVDGALEMLRLVSECLPPLPDDEKEISIELLTWNFKRGEFVKFSGEAATAQLVYEFKNRLVESKAFVSVGLNGPQLAKGNRQRFDIECSFVMKEEK